MSCCLEVRELPGRGRGLCATRPIAMGEVCLAVRAVGMSLYAHDKDYPPEQSLCHGCITFGRRLPLVCAGGCGATYCSEACAAADAAAGHAFCCPALRRISEMASKKKYTRIELSAACFLLRVFAAEKAWKQRSAGDTGASLLDEALLQCPELSDDPEFAAHERTRTQAVKIAALLAGALVPRDKALELLRREPHNSYTLRDATNACRGWIMYPIASYINHSCLPNTACVVSAGGVLTFYALTPIAMGEEITQSYLTDQSDGDCTSKAWGFQCTCPRCTRTATEQEMTTFDARHVCACGTMVTSARGGGRACRCHDQPDARMPPRAPGELRVVDVDVRLPNGSTSRVSLYGRAPAFAAQRPDVAVRESAKRVVTGDLPPRTDGGRQEDMVMDMDMAPVVAVSPANGAEAEADHAFLQSMWSDQRACAGQMASFHLHADPVHDEWSTRAGFSPDQLARLRLLLRSRLFDVWAGLLAAGVDADAGVGADAPALARLSGTIEIFNPAIGANMGWHRDGHGPGEFIAHYYLGCPSRSQDGTILPASGGKVPMGWSEVAMPHGSGRGDRGDVSDGSDDDSSEFLLDFGQSDGEERAGVSEHNVLLFEHGVAADQRLVIFEDARVFHRTPLTAYAASERLQDERQRPIARVVFHGVSADGASVGFSYPHATQSSPRGDDKVASEAIHSQKVAEEELPPGLRRAIEAHAEQHADDEAGASEGAVQEGSSCRAVSGVTAANMRTSFEAYVAGTPSMIRCIQSTL